MFSRELIFSIPKTVSENGCWIPSELKPDSTGYIRIMINSIRYSLHRLSMCIFNDIDYYNQRVDTRHSRGCSKACFNPEHLKPGSQSDNERDKVEFKENFNSRKEVCPKCGGQFTQYRIKSGPRKGDVFRECAPCRNRRRKVRRRK